MSATKRPPQKTADSKATEMVSADDWLKPGWFALGLAVMVFVAYPQVLLGLETFVSRDFGLFSYPCAYFQRSCFWRGELPFWNPYTYCGVPFLAQWNTLPLYPPALIYLLLPLGWSLSFFCLLHLWFGGLGMYWLANRWAANRLAAGIAGLAFTFNGLSMNLLMWPSHIATLSWMPWVVLVVQRAWQQGGRWFFAAAAIGTLQMLAGGPETILLTWLLLSGLWLPDVWKSWRASSTPQQNPLPRACAWRYPLLVLLVAGLAAAQLLPFLDLAAHSQRDIGFADTRWSMPLTGWANFLVPMAFGRTYTENVFFQSGQYWTSSYYLGVSTVLLALLSLGGLRQGRVCWLLAATLLAYFCSLGDQTWVLRSLRQALPQLTLMTYPVKFVVVIVFALPLLAALALSRLRQSSAEEVRCIHRQLWWLLAALLLVIGVILIWAWTRSAQNFQLAWRNGLIRAAFLAVTAAALVWLGRTRSPQSRQVLSMLLLVIFWLDLRTHEPEQNPTVSPAVYAPGMVRAELGLKPEPTIQGPRVMLSPMADILFDRTHKGDVKDIYLAQRLGYFSDCNLLDEVPKINGFFSLSPRETSGLTGLFYVFTNLNLAPLEDFLSIGYVTAPGELTQWQSRPTSMPLATAGQTPLFLDDTNAVHRMMRLDFDPTQVVFLPPDTQTQVGVTNQTRARVLSQHFDLRHAELEVEAPGPSLVVIAQSYYHFWRGYFDDQQVPVLRANLALQAIQIPAGRHHVRLVYEDRAFQLGAVISALTLLGCVIGCLLLRKTSSPPRNRNPNPAP